MLVASISILVREGRPVHVRLALTVVLAFWCAQALVTGWAVAPEAPTAHAYYGQWEHVFPATVPFRGKVTDAKLDARLRAGWFPSGDWPVTPRHG